MSGSSQSFKCPFRALFDKVDLLQLCPSSADALENDPQRDFIFLHLSLMLENGWLGRLKWERYWMEEQISTVSSPREACQDSMWTAAKQNTGAFPVKTSTLLQIEEKLTFWFGVFLQLRSNATGIVLKIISGGAFFKGLRCLPFSFIMLHLRWLICATLK